MCVGGGGGGVGGWVMFVVFFICYLVTFGSVLFNDTLNTFYLCDDL